MIEWDRTILHHVVIHHAQRVDAIRYVSGPIGRQHTKTCCRIRTTSKGTLARECLIVNRTIERVPKSSVA